MAETRPVSWVKAARKDFLRFPLGAQTEIAHALTMVAGGGYPDLAKPLKGFGSGVFELALRHRTDAWRVVYAVRLGAEIWVRHAFQKKAKSGIKTPQAEIDVIEQRLRRVKEALQ